MMCGCSGPLNVVVLFWLWSSKSAMAKQVTVRYMPDWKTKRSQWKIRPDTNYISSVLLCEECSHSWHLLAPISYNHRRKCWLICFSFCTCHAVFTECKPVFFLTFLIFMYHITCSFKHPSLLTYCVLLYLVPCQASRWGQNRGEWHSFLMRATASGCTLKVLQYH